jgi:pimeloyl-ACP methyl ester carboxylesterase
MATAKVNGLTLGYEVIGDGAGRPWSITPGGRFTKESPGVRQLAETLAAAGHRVLIWDRPNCGESDVCFEGSSESAVQADALVALLEHLDMTPAVISGGSGGARVSLLAASRHPEAAAGVAVWWISGGVYGLLSLATHYCGGSLAEAWRDGMAAVAALPEWAEVVERNPSNRQRFLDQDRAEFIATMERWMVAYCPRDGEHIPGLPDADARAMDLPALVFRSGESDPHHTRVTSEALAAMLPRARLVEPPWGDREWIERQEARDEGLFARWPLLAPQLLEWQAETLG